MMKTLSLTYKGYLGKTHTLKLKYAKEGLDPKEVRSSMQELATANAFTKDNDKDNELMFVTPVCAKYITTTEETIFDDRKKTPEK